MMGIEGWPAFKQRVERLPYGLMSLLAMMNSSVSAISPLCSQLMLEMLLIKRDIEVDPFQGAVWVENSEKERLRQWLNIAKKVADDFEMRAVHDRIEIFNKKLEKGIRLQDLQAELRVLRETIDAGLKHQLIYRYPDEKSVVLDRWKEDWAAVLKAFPSSGQDIIAAVDCWALGHSTASVFHLMRVLEHGLRALATNVGKSFDVQNWQNIIDQIESETRQLGKTLPAGQSKSDRLRFLSEAAKEFMYFKDGWRNYVSHNRAVYDEHQARSALEHVRSFMTILSSELHE